MAAAGKAKSGGRTRKTLHQLGPGLVTGAADDDPSGIATYSQAGAQFGFGLLWTMLLTYPLMTAVQFSGAHIGRVTGTGLAENMKALLWRPAVIAIVVLLFVANTINIGADLAAMGAAAKLALGVNAFASTVGFALLSLLLQFFIPYRRYASLLKWLTLVLLAYIALLFMVKLDWGAVARGLFVPTIAGHEGMTTVVAILGTTISPYLFFWQTAQEVERVGQKPHSKPLVDAPEQADKARRRIRIDTFAGMAVSNIVAIAIMIGTAATLHMSGKTSIDTAADAAKALEPVAGVFAFALFSLGIIGTGMLAVPVLAGSVAYAAAETGNWENGLDRKPWEAWGFYGVIAAATLLGLGVGWSPLDPIQALFWSAVINGVVAVPIMIVMMVIVSRRDTMGEFTASPLLRFFGWAATLVMAAAVAAMGILALV
jgi:NRAMP (natural resistance-associated macrophage protein)-like metal ion transporter